MTEPNYCSVVIPVYNEEVNVDPLYEALTTAVSELNVDWEFIFIDDGSRDNTVRCVLDLHQRDPRVKLLRFSRNFGSHAALSAGLKSAGGDAAIILSADLQDPPELIPTLLDKWREGNDVVWAVRESRDDPFMKQLFATLFYRLFRKVALSNYPEEGMDFGLFDRKVLDVLGELTEHNHFVTAMIVWAGFRVAHIPYERRARHAGESKWSMGKRIKAAIDAIISFSYFPIRLIAYLGMAVSAFSLLYAVYIVVRRVFFNLGGEGWPSVMVAVLFLGGVQLITLAVLGEYLWRVAEDAKSRPLYIIAERFGFETTRSNQ